MKRNRELRQVWATRGFEFQQYRLFKVCVVLTIILLSVLTTAAGNASPTPQDYAFLDSLRLPWGCGDKEPRRLTQDWIGHQAVGFALDFGKPPSGESVEGTSILAPYGGTACYKQQKDANGNLVGYGNYVDIDIGNGWQVRLAHLLDANTGCRSVAMRDVVGRLGGSGGWTPHIHVEVLRNWGGVDPNQVTRIFGHPRDDFLYAPDKYFYSNNCGTCSAPSLNSPNDGYIHTSSERTITFSWSPPSNCTPDGYTFRVSTSSSMDIVPGLPDRGEGGTQTTHTFGSEWDNRDLWWSVRACKPCTPFNPGPWAPSRRFRIEPGAAETHLECRSDWCVRVSGPGSDQCWPEGSYCGGWQVEYFRNTMVSDLCANRNESGTFVFRDWQEDAPAGGCPSDNWSARFRRRVYFQSGSYTFGLGSDDWARIYVGSDLVVDNWEGHGQHYESRYRNEGEDEVRVEFADTMGRAWVAAWWWGPGFDMPRESKDPNQWYAEYWGNKDLSWDSIIRVNEGTSLNHEWYGEGPGYALPDDRFSSRFERRVHFSCGRYRFTAFSDDGVRFKIKEVNGGNWLINEWHDGRSTYSTDVDLVEGDYTLVVEHYENGGWASISLDWEFLQGCADTTPPTGRITSPSAGSATNSCPITIQADASDDQSGVDFVEFHVWYDGSWHHIGNDSTAPYSMSWDCSGVSDQMVWLTIHILDKAGNEAMDPGGYVDIILDGEPPSGTITSPQQGGYLTGNYIIINALAQDAQSGVQSVQFFVGYNDGTAWNWHHVATDSDGGDGWSATWDASQVDDQLVAFWIYIFDRAGNLGSDSIGDVALDRTPPSSWVDPLPEFQHTNSFEVSWSHDSDLSGIREYWVQYRYGKSGMWQSWTAGPGTSRQFRNADDGVTYYFQVRAIDNAGNWEEYPGGDGDTHTTIDLAPSCPHFSEGDANCDKTVDLLDFAIWWLNYGTGLAADFNDDGITDELDYVIWWRNYGRSW